MSGTVPTALVVRRLSRELAERDHLLDLLARVEAGHVITNRLNEAILLVPEDVLAEIRQALGVGSPETEPTEQ